MGCGNSQVSVANQFIINERKPGQGRAAAKDFRKLELKDETLDQLFDQFCRIDRDRSGQVDLDEFYRYFCLERSPFSDRVFAIIDENRNGEVDFHEFVLMVWNFCSLDTRALSDFAFSLFDLDHTGYLEMQEIRDLVAEVYGDLFESNRRILRLLDSVNKDNDGRLSQSEFRELNRKYSVILFPGFRMQQELRRKVLGEKFWEQQLKERMRAGVSMTTSIWEVLDKMDVNNRRSDQRQDIEALKAQRWMPGQANLPTNAKKNKARR